MSGDGLTPEQLVALDKAVGEKPAVPAAKAMVSFVLDTMDLVRSEDGNVYAVPDGSTLAIPLRGTGGLRQKVQRDFFNTTGRVPSQQALADCLSQLEAEGAEATIVPTYTRVAPLGAGVLVDLGRPDQQVVHITEAGWVVRALTAGDPLFRRPGHQGEMPLPTSGGIQELWSILNVNEVDQMLVLGFAVSAFLPWVLMPILLIEGPAGSGKTTSARFLVDLLDPGRGALGGPVRTERDWAAKAQGRRVVGVDNLSVISNEMSDVYCRAVTGDEITSRSLYTNDDLHVSVVRCGIVMTSIDPGARRGDLAERMVRVTLDPLTGRVLPDAEMVARRQKLKPALLGAVFDEVVLLLQALPRLKTPEEGWPRLADYGMVLAALDYQHDGGALSRYVTGLTDAAVGIVTDDPLASAVMDLVAEDKVVEMSATRLFALLRRDDDDVLRVDSDRSWKTPAIMSGLLKRAAPGMLAAGVEISWGRTTAARNIRIRRLK